MTDECKDCAVCTYYIADRLTDENKEYAENKQMAALIHPQYNVHHLKNKSLNTWSNTLCAVSCELASYFILYVST